MSKKEGEKSSLFSSATLRTELSERGTVILIYFCEKYEIDISDVKCSSKASDVGCKSGVLLERKINF